MATRITRAEDQGEAAQETAEEAAPAQAGLSRRGFLGRAGGVAAATVTAGTLGGLSLPGEAGAAPATATVSSPGQARADRAYTVRVNCARNQRVQPIGGHSVNGDETAYSTRIGSYTKGLPHNALGDVDPAAYAALLAALASGRPADFEALPLGGKAKLAGPQSSYAFMLQGTDSGRMTVLPAPAFSSAEEAGEMAEMYWQALARDVPFTSYATDPLVSKAAADLSRMSDFKGPKANGVVTPATVFRQGVPSEMNGPYISQFLWQPVPYGVQTVPQLYPVAPSKDFMTTYDAWLTVQQGRYSPPKPGGAPSSPPPTRYMITGRDLATYLHADFIYQAYLNAALILNKLGALDAGNPYLHSRTQAGVGTFGPHHLFDLVAKVANAAVKACWYQKWLVHRRVRPEEFGGRVHNHKIGVAEYPIHADLLGRSGALSAIYQKHGTYLLPLAYPEGSPMHPSYPAGHPAITGACVTVLKAFFDESAVIPNPVVASADGSTLLPYAGATLTVGGELNKLAGNLAAGRAFGGVHWRSDNATGLEQGEAIAINMLADENNTYNEKFSGFSLTKFDGTTITI